MNLHTYITVFLYLIHPVDGTYISHMFSSIIFNGKRYPTLWYKPKVPYEGRLYPYSGNLLHLTHA